MILEVPKVFFMLILSDNNATSVLFKAVTVFVYKSEVSTLLASISPPFVTLNPLTLRF